MAKKNGKTVIYTRSLGRAVARAAKRSRPGRFHVIPSIANRGKWSLVSEGSLRTLRVFATKNAAVSFVKKSKTVKETSYVVIHDRNGKIQDTVSFQPRNNF